MESTARLRKRVFLVLMVIVLAALVLSLGAALGTGDWPGLVLNLGTELAGVTVIYYLFERVIQHTEKLKAIKEERQAEKADLIAQLGSNVRDVAEAAAAELRRRGWLSDGSLQGADLDGANLQGVTLSAANLQGATLSGANLQGANLMGARLQGADLDGANLQEVDLNRAKLQRANLWRANLDGGNLQEANLDGAKLLGAGGGGFLLMICTSPDSAIVVQEMLEKDPPNERARWFDYDVSEEGLIVTVC